MGILKRAKDIISANVNSMLDQAENPEAMINQIIRELEVAISDLKCSATNKLANKKTLERRVLDSNKEIARWIERAELAVESKKDELAKEALREKGIATSKLDDYNADIARIDEELNSYKEQILQMEEKLLEMISKKKTLLARIVKAEEKNYTNSVLDRASGVEILEKFSRFESRIERMEAESEIFNRSIYRDFEAMEQDSQVEEELKELKSKLKEKK